MACKIIIFSILAMLTLSTCDALRLLVFFPIPSESHKILGQAMVTRLLEAGHEVVHVTTYPRDEPAVNLTEIKVQTPVQYMKKEEEIRKAAIYGPKDSVGRDSLDNFYLFMHNNHRLQTESLEDPDLMTVLNDPEQQFDAVILEWYFCDLIAGVAALFRSPLIWFAPLHADWKILKLVDSIPNPTYNVDIFSINRPPLSFMQRYNEIYSLFGKLFSYNVMTLPHERRTYKELFTKIADARGVSMPSYEEAIYNGTFLFLNSHPSIGTPVNLPQNVKYIAGYHIDVDVQPLPKGLQMLMDGAKDGVIYFSMGTSLKSIDMTEYMRHSLLDMFSKLNQTVIWEYEGDVDQTPKNVHFFKFVPHHSVLAHPNLEFFITHGGHVSTTEAVHFGVPVIGIPVHCDQYANMLTVSNKGLGIMIHLEEETVHDIADDIYVAIKEMLGNSSYKTKAQEISTLYHDRPELPDDELIFWIEYVVRYKGAPHLKSLALSLPIYKRLYMDVIIVSIAALITLVIALKKCMYVYKGDEERKTRRKAKKEKRR